MMSKKSPQLRFEGFTDDWEQRKLTDITSSYSGLTYSPTDVQDKGTFVLRSSNVKNDQLIDADNVYVNPDIVNSNNVKVGDVIVVVRNGSRSLIGKHAIVTKEMPHTVIGAFMSAFRGENGDYINALLSTNNFQKEVHKSLGATINQITGKDFSMMNFQTPKLEEQNKIGSFFKQLDNTIALHQRKLDLLKEQKKGYLQKMFPKNGEKVPELRFAGFADDWEERKLGEISKTTIGEFVIKTKQSDESPYPVYNGGKSYTGKYDEYNNDGPKIVISARGANAGFVNYVSGRYWAGNSCYSVSVTKEDEFSIGYLYQFIKYNQVLFTAYQQAANIPSVSKSDVEKFSIKYPTVLEQKKIESFFKQLDETIALHQRKLDLLKEQKKSFLQKMFV